MNSAAPEAAEKISGICSECGADLVFPVGAMQVRCGHCDAGLVVEKGQRLVRLNCPVCAGNFYYLDGAMAGHCPYCEASLLALSRHRLLRYVIRPADGGPPPGAEGAELVLVPFWHLTGLLLGWDVGRQVTRTQDHDPYAYTEQPNDPNAALPTTTRTDSGPLRSFRARVVDLNLPDHSARALGITSLRLRAAIFPLEPFSAEHESLGRVCPPLMPLRDARDHLQERAIRLGDPTDGMTQLDAQRLDLVCQEMALYYYPFWLRSGGDKPRLWDGVSGQPEALGSAVTAPEGEGALEGAFDQLKVLELRCEACGEPLTPGNHSMVIPCTACGAFWEVTREGLSPKEAHFARAPGGGVPEGIVWLPFWCVPVRARYGGKLAHRVADLRNVLGVMRPIADYPRAAPDDQLCYYVAAYGSLMAPRVDHAARDLTMAQPLLKHGAPGPGEQFHCFFSAEDARRLGYVTLLRVITGTVPHRIRSMRLETRGAKLWYIPFQSKGRELTNLLTGRRYDRDAFRGLGH